MQSKLAYYTGRYKLLMLITVPLFAFSFNLINFYSTYFSGLGPFLAYSFISLLGYTGYFISGRVLDVSLKKRLPAEHQLYMRLSIAVLVLLLITGLFLYFFLQWYALIPWFKYTFNESDFMWSFILLGILNIFLAFLMEGIEHYRYWKESYRETEKLNATYKQSQINGLKSQVNPHFLFNSLNSLSSLIQEDEDRAETFLNEMSKVYRYMLRNDDEQLVTLETELKFLSSYMHLLQARYGEGLQLQVNITGEHKTKILAPLTLQVVVENAFTQNVVSKSAPLHIEIFIENNCLVIKNNLQLKSVSGAIDFEAGLDNLIRKYELLGNTIHVKELSEKQRTIIIPLLESAKETAR